MKKSEQLLAEFRAMHPGVNCTPAEHYEKAIEHATQDLTETLDEEIIQKMLGIINEGFKNSKCKHG